MDKNLKLILNEYEEYKGQFVISVNGDIERLVVIGDDGFDYYFVTFNGIKFKWGTCVGRIMPLKGYLRDKDYNELVRLAKLNHIDFINIDVFNKWFKEWKDGLTENYKFHTDFCFDTINN